VVILVNNCEDIMAHWLLDVGIEIGFADVGFGAVNALQRGAGVEDEAVGTVADNIAYSQSVSSYFLF
jgi:hypothetical protein